MINKVSDVTIGNIKVSEEMIINIGNKSAKTLPDRPSGRGMTPDKIKEAFFAPIVDSEKSIVTEINRIVEMISSAINVIVGQANDDIGGTYNQLLSEIASREEGDAWCAKAITDLIVRLEDLKAYVDSGDDNLDLKIRANAEEIDKKIDKSSARFDTAAQSIAKRTDSGELFVETKDGGNEKGAVNKAYLSKTVGVLEAQIAGKTRSYVINGVSDLKYETDGLSTIADKLRTGDNVYLLESDVPDFWFEETTDESKAEKLDIVGEFGTVLETIDLVVQETSYPYTVYGVLHKIEAEKPNFDPSIIGDIDEALDSILAIQDAVLGGGV